MEIKCNICSNTKGNISYEGREMMFGFRDKFDYFRCSKCGCLQIVKPPNNLNKYYPSNYYSYNITKRKSLKYKIVSHLLRKSIKHRLGVFNLTGLFAMKYNKYYKNIYPWLTKKHFTFNSRILDIGCGSGDLLLKLHDFGFDSLEGIDPFVEKDLKYFDNVEIFKKSIYDIDKYYDMIMMHHSLEHMPDPQAVFAKLGTLITNDGTILIRIPVLGGYAWRKYGMNWFQIDAPRHFFLHTIHSMSILAESNGLKIENVIFDSTDSQFIYSEKYNRNISLNEANIPLDKKQQKIFKRLTSELNCLMDGDQACFYLKKIK